MKASYFPFQLHFILPSGTSRGIMHKRDVFFIKLTEDTPAFGLGECAPLRGLSIDDTPEYEQILAKVCNNPSYYLLNKGELLAYPSILFGLETAYLDLTQGANGIIYESDFTVGKASIAINGLIWMGSIDQMKQQVRDKIDGGSQVIKTKIGAIDFEKELQFLRWIRSEFSAEKIVLRLDANGAFTADEAFLKLKRLAELDIHSIEQPIQVNQVELMASLVATSPIPIALDEELISITSPSEKENILKQIRPPYIILKPSLHGGILGCNQWITIADKLNIKWWMTSALESNIGLNAIAQYTYTLKNNTTHGLGTGGLFSNNIDSPLFIKDGSLYFAQNEPFNLPQFIR